MIYNHKKSSDIHITLNDMRIDLECMRSIIYYRERSDKSITDHFVYAYKSIMDYYSGNHCAKYKVYFDKNNNCHFSKIK